MELLLAKRIIHKNTSKEEVIKLLEENLCEIYKKSLIDKEYYNEDILKLKTIGSLNDLNEIDFRKIVTVNGVPQIVLVEANKNISLFFDNEQINLKFGEILSCMFCVENSFYVNNGDVINATFVE